MSKHPARSKTLGVAVLNVLVLAFVPGAKDWVRENPEAYAEILSATMIGLRLITTKALTWRRKDPPDNVIDFTGTK